MKDLAYLWTRLNGPFRAPADGWKHLLYVAAMSTGKPLLFDPLLVGLAAYAVFVAKGTGGGKGKAAALGGSQCFERIRKNICGKVSAWCRVLRRPHPPRRPSMPLPSPPRCATGGHLAWALQGGRRPR